MAGLYMKGASSPFLTLPSRMDKLTLLAVLWAAAGTYTLTFHLMKLQNILESRAPGVLRVARVWPAHVLPNPSLVVGFLKPSGAHLSKLPECL